MVSKKLVDSLLATHTQAHQLSCNKQAKDTPTLHPLTLFLSMYVLFCGCSMCVAAQLLERDAYCIGSMKMMEISTIATCTGSSEHICLSLAKDKAGPCSANHKYDVACNKFLYSLYHNNDKNFRLHCWWRSGAFHFLNCSHLGGDKIALYNVTSK
jgi:hypothetical protein